MSEQASIDPNIELQDLDVINKQPQIISNLDLFKGEQKEMAEQQAEIIYLGELKGLTEKDHWTGNISLKKRIESGQLTEARIDEQTATLNSHFVRVSVGAPKRCVDGSTIMGYDDSDPEWYGRPLGPQIQGGTNGDATGIRLKSGYREGATLVHDVNTVIEGYQGDFSPGDHTDDHAEQISNEDKTGCGQIDGHLRRSETFADPAKSKTLVTILSGLYEKAGLVFPEDKVNNLLINGKSINENAEKYYARGNRAVLDLIKSSNPNPYSIEKLVRPHNEVSLSINFV